ncbi:zinc finger, CCHC-type containing protein [Tanacetum coccineum]|uniref:Zinc finger, CCHC-type containing protein n=1 Tax=Tanacetum coccineum TaxID=301880 RepID=A0ABQ5AAQ5_9ASTR
MRFFSLKGAWGRERRKGKITGSANDVAKDIINVVSFVVDEPVLSSLGGHTGEKVIASGNYNGTQERNVVQCSTSIRSTVDLNEGEVPLIKAFVVPINVTDLPTTDPNNSGLILSGPTSYAKLLTSEPSRKSVNFGTLIALARNEVDVAISLESVRAISERFADTIYGFLSGKHIVYLLVDNYVKNTCNKYGLVKQMLNSSNGLFLFKFSSKDVMDSMLENGLWFIRNTSFILKSGIRVNLIKEDVGNVPVWVKFHGVPMTVLSEDGLSVIAIKLGPPLCICNHEYEWIPPMYSSWKVFGHVVDECPKKIVSNVVKNLENPRQVARGVLVGPKRKLMFLDDDGKPLYKADFTSIADSDSEVEEVFN